MSEDWDTVTKIGSKVRSGGGGPREAVVKGNSALNAARRSGAAISTEKKYSTANAASSGSDGQRLTKVDRSDDIIKPKTVGTKVGDAIKKARAERDPPMLQKDLAQKANTTTAIVGQWERGDAAPNQDLLIKFQKALGIKLSGNNIGEPLFKKKDTAAKK